MIQQKLLNKKVEIARGPYNEIRGDTQAIRITEGCPHNHEYCYEPTEIKVFGIPEIVRNKVLIYDMNLLCKPEALEIIRDLGATRVSGKVVYYELVCGVDYRLLTDEIAKSLKHSRFIKIRLAWDLEYSDQFGIKKAIDMLIKVGYKPNDIMIFMICNWKIPYDECCKKLDLCKVWNVKVADCYWDNQLSPIINPEYWTHTQIKDFRRKVRKHNQIVNFKIDPDIIGKKEGD